MNPANGRQPGRQNRILQRMLQAARVYKVRRALSTDTRRALVFVSLRHPHLIVVGLFGWRVLLHRSGQAWWETLNRVELWKYHFPWRRK